MNILVVGSGGREHAIVWKLAKSPKVSKIYCAPGNAGIASDAECLEISANDIEGLLAIAKEKKIDLTVVGPEVPLSLGIVNLFEQEHYPVFGPTKEAAEIESSKVFAKYFMEKYQIPTAKYRVFEDYSQAVSYLYSQTYPLVLKADGLAAGKGVLIANNYLQAEQAVNQIMKEKKFGDAGRRVIVEEFLSGEEVSMLIFSDGKNLIPMIASQDHKKIYDGDQGPNTGGMGAYTPVYFLNEDMQRWVLETIFHPVVQGMEKEGRPFKGILYAGLILTEQGPKVLEFNVRFGDPETQVILPGLKTDLVEIIQATVGGYLDKIDIEWIEQATVCIVMASNGYPGKYEKGRVINGLESINKEGDVMVFHAGTEKKGDHIVTAGGRVLGVTAWADSLPVAIEKAYNGVRQIDFENKYFRKDIGSKGLIH